MNQEDKRAVGLFQNHRRVPEGNETEVRHYLYVDRAGDAERLGKRLARDGFGTTVRKSSTGEKWLVLVAHRISVEESSIETFRDFLEAAVAKVKGGEYDGWEAEV
jgi:Regulator of ribonuclease activity B